MEIYQLRTFCKVAELGNLTRAAEKLFSSQPAVSAHIKALEEEFGIALFDRTAKGMRLTAAGESVLRDAEKLLQSSEEILRKAVSLREEVSGTIRIGFNNTQGVLFSDRIILGLARQFPQLGYSISYGASGDIMSGLETGALDVGFFEGQRQSPGIVAEQIGAIDLCIAIPAQRERQLADADWSVMAAQTWLFGSPLCSYSGLMNQLAEEKHLHLGQRVFITDDSMWLRFVANDLAVCLAPRIGVEQFMPHGQVKIWPHFSHRMPLFLAYSKSRAEEPAIGAFIRETRRVWNLET